MAKRTLRAAKLETSKRLQDMFWILASGKELSTLQLISRSGRCAINSIIAEMRDTETTDNGLTIHCKPRKGVYYYRLERNAEFHEWRLKLGMREAI